MKITGNVAVFGVNGDVLFSGVGIIQPANMVTQGLGLKQTTKTADLVDGEGNVMSRVYYGAELRISLTFGVRDATTPGDETALKTSIKLVEAGTKVTISNATLPIYNGDWNAAGDADVQPIQANHLKYSCTLERIGKPALGTSNATFLSDTP